ncbi:MAG: YbhN family protein, partial [Acidimicrobiia bacterium]
LVVVGIWDQLARIAVPVAGAVLVAAANGLPPVALTTILVGVLFVVTAVVALVLLFRSDGPARWAGRVGGRLASWAARPFGKGPFDWSEQAILLRRQTVGLTSVRWPALTASAIAAQLMLGVLLYASLRAVGLGVDTVSFIQVVGVYSLARAVTLPGYTPGGVGVVELVFITLLAETAPAATEELIAAGVFLWRALTYLLPILGGLVSWVVWRTKSSWRQDPQEALRGDRYAGPEPATASGEGPFDSSDLQ